VVYSIVQNETMRGKHKFAVPAVQGLAAGQACNEENYHSTVLQMALIMMRKRNLCGNITDY
jgi:hypothetical protein